VRWDGSRESRGESYQSRSSKGKVELDGLGGIETNYSSAGEGGDDWSAGTILGLRARGVWFLGEEERMGRGKRRRKEGKKEGREEGRKGRRKEGGNWLKHRS